MYCRFCGKEILDDSQFCPYCGGMLASAPNQDREKRAAIHDYPTSTTEEDATPQKHNEEYYRNQAKKTAGYQLMDAAKYLCYTALGVFLFLNIKMSPSYGWMKFLAYVVMAGIAILCVWGFNKVYLVNQTKIIYTATIGISIFVILASIGLRLIYETKVDQATADIPSAGNVLLTMTENAEYYSYTGEGYVTDPGTTVILNDSSLSSGDRFRVVLGKKYPLRVGAHHNTGHAYMDTSISFDAADLHNGPYKISKEVFFKSGNASSAVVTLTFERCCTFWEVIFY